MWKHKKKYRGRMFHGDYENMKNSLKREFVLSDGIREYRYRSWQVAIKEGWLKINAAKQRFWE